MATKLFKVITNDNLRVRTSPEVSRTNLIQDRYLVRDDILEVRADSCKEGSGWWWWEHASNAGFWTASQNSNGTVMLMADYQPENIIEPAPNAAPNTDIIQVFEVNDYLNIRSAPKFGMNIIAGQQLRPGMRLAFHNPTKADNYQWWEMVDKPNHWAASGSLSGGIALMTPVIVKEVTEETVVKPVVPWITQVQSGHNFANDCGHTCTLMIMRYLGKGWDKTVGDLYELRQFRHERGWTVAAGLKGIAGHFGVAMQDFSKQNAVESDMEWLKQTIREKGPVVLLVWYPTLGFNNSFNGPFNHWIAITGYSDNKFYLNDPLWITENKGANREVSQAVLLKACQNTQSSTHFTGIHPA